MIVAAFDVVAVCCAVGAALSVRFSVFADAAASCECLPAELLPVGWEFVTSAAGGPPHTVSLLRYALSVHCVDVWFGIAIPEVCYLFDGLRVCFGPCSLPLLVCLVHVCTLGGSEF